MANPAIMPRPVVEVGVFHHGSDFCNFVTAQDGWTSLVADAGTSAAVSDAANGVLALGTAATDNNEVMVRSTAETYLVAAGRSIHGRWRIQFSEANTDDANIAVGFASAAGANLLVDDGAGPRTSGNQFLIYKVDGETVWRVQARNGSEVETYTTESTAGGSSYQELEIDIVEESTTEVLVSFKLNGSFLTDAAYPGTPIRARINIASSTEMNLVVGYAKAGGANAETLNIDYAHGYQTR
jgi:hypothetical protein